jgi:predicted dehydrogenase
MKRVRYGIVGLGNMGSGHLKSILAAKDPSFSLTAVCDTKPAKKTMADEAGVAFFTDCWEMIDSKLIDALIIATPHYWHAPQAIYAARKGVHVLCEKPLSSTVGHARQMIKECKRRKVHLGVVLHHRTRDVMQRLKAMTTDGTLGEVFRVSLVCSNWFRSQAYYDSGDWRGTWDGEGGGVLINQAPHHLDLFNWIGGMPNRVRAVIGTREHKIEVEDTANIICEYPKGKVGYIYATTAEQPGMEQFVISGNKATAVWEGGKLRLGRLQHGVKEFIYADKSGFGGQKCTWEDVNIQETGGRHIMVIAAFAKTILTGKKFPYATGEDALGELELSNAAYISGYKGKPVDLPVDAEEIERLITKLTRERSTGRGGNLRGKAGKLMRKLGL